MATLQQKLAKAQEALNRVNLNPRLRIVPDQITGRTFSLCVMETDEPHEGRIQRHITEYHKPEDLTLIIEGIYLGVTNPYL